MLLQAQLTIGWHDGPEKDFAATRLHETALKAGKGYSDTLATTLKAVGKAPISGLESLFRRRTRGFETLKKFVAALVSLPHPAATADPLICRIDAFAYAFLRGAKNLDFQLPLDDKLNAEFRKTHAAWSHTIMALEDFERLGRPLVKDANISTDHYLALRHIISRPSARDERRTLATLMVSGPSSMKEISEDLGLNYSLGQRTVATFLEKDLVERRSGEIFAIAEPALPLAVFGLRESMGLDLLTVLQKED